MKAFMRRLLVVLALVSMLTPEDEKPYACGTDTECEEQCREFLRPDEDPAICDVEA